MTAVTNADMGLMLQKLAEQLPQDRNPYIYEHPAPQLTVRDITGTKWILVTINPIGEFIIRTTYDRTGIVQGTILKWGLIKIGQVTEAIRNM